MRLIEKSRAAERLAGACDNDRVGGRQGSCAHEVRRAAPRGDHSLLCACRRCSVLDQLAACGWCSVHALLCASRQRSVLDQLTACGWCSSLRAIVCLIIGHRCCTFSIAALLFLLSVWRCYFFDALGYSCQRGSLMPRQLRAQMQQGDVEVWFAIRPLAAAFGKHTFRCSTGHDGLSLRNCV